MTDPISIPVDDGVLGALRFGTGPRIALAAHGITASAMSFGAVARHLPEGWSLVAVDLRGRGSSASLPGPYGIDRHAADLSQAAEHLTAGQVALVGQSLGAYVALRAAARRPELFDRLVLVDGGLPLPVPPGVDPDHLLDVSIGPALARLRMTFPTEEAYLDFFRAHPALSGAWNCDVEAYVRYDLTGEPGALRSRVNEEAVRVDGRELLAGADSFGTDLIGLTVPVLLLTAPRGMLGEPPGLHPEPLVGYWRQQAPRLRHELVEDTNHYTILLADRAATTLARRITDSGTWPDP
ncbi:MAG: alpha/beta hydrolase [Actinobacteria bacterium 13_1_20CM_3_71_11]|nr:MAG: alpha/beta hydrolase [Actinobacteria bacterium 13_1_20CM_3_71_11]